MKQITTIDELNDAIQLLEIKHAGETMLLKDQLKITYENLRPVNLIKNTFRDLATSSGNKEGIFESILSNSAGYVSKIILTGSSLNPLKIISGKLLQLLVTTVISQNAGGIKRAAAGLFNKTVSRKDKVET